MLGNRSGMALVLTLLAVSFLVAVTVQLGTSVNWQMRAAAGQRDIVQLDAMLFSGLNLARAALLADQQENDHDSLFDDWGEFDQELIAAIFTDGSLNIKVTDLSGLLQVNALVPTKEEKERRKKEQQEANRKNKKKKRKKQQKKDLEKMHRQLWLRFLQIEEFGIENEEAAVALVDCLIDWLDEDDEEQEHGAEQGYYSGQNPSYAPANGQLMFLDELLLIKDWNKKLLNGDKEHSGIINYLTIGGQNGKININTAPALVLQSLHEDMTEELASDLVDFRLDEENKELLAQQDWYKQVSGFPGDITFDKELITLSSNYFLVTVTARLGEMQRIGSGMIMREDNHEQALLYWKVE